MFFNEKRNIRVSHFEYYLLAYAMIAQTLLKKLLTNKNVLIINCGIYLYSISQHQNQIYSISKVLMTIF